MAKKISGILSFEAASGKPIVSLGDAMIVVVKNFKHRLIDRLDAHGKLKPDTAPAAPRKLKSGDLVTIFKNVTDGDIQWQGDVKLDYDSGKVKSAHSDYKGQAVFGHWVNGLQQGMTPDQWGAMFWDALPARLEKKDGTVVLGALYPFSETGSEGVLWSVQAYDKESYAGLNILQDGDRLTVFRSVVQGEIAWRGRLDFVRNTVKMVLPVREVPADIPLNDWLRFAGNNAPIVIEPK